MKHLILLLLVSALGYGQQYLDTLYIVFDGKHYQEKIDPEVLSTPKFLEPEVIYAFYFDEEKKSFFRFTRAKYFDIDSLEKNKVADKKIIDKSFLKKNKINVLNFKNFRKKGIAKSFWDFHGSIIYIADKTEMKHGKIPIYQVRLYTTYYPQD